MARAVQRGLHRFAKPIWRASRVHVYRDETDLAASPEFWPVLQKAMDGSRFLVLLLSPAAVRSEWVSREVGAWLESGKADNLRLVLVDGDLVWDDAAGGFDASRSTAVPAPLTVAREPGRHPPKFVDLRGVELDHMHLKDATFRAAILDLAADLHGRPKAELDSDDLREQRKLRRFRRASVAGLAVLTVVALASAVVAVNQARRATDKAEEAQRQQALAEGRELAARALSADDPIEGLLLAVESELRTPTPTDESLRAYALVSQDWAQTSARPTDEPIPAGKVNTLDRSDESGLLALGGDAIEVWDAATLEPVGTTLQTSTDDVLATAFSPDGSLLAVGGIGPVTLWELPGGRRLAPPAANAGDIGSISWLPAGESFATTDSNGELRIWRGPDWTMNPTPAITGLAPGSAVDWSSDGKHVALAGADGNIHVFDGVTLQPEDKEVRAQRESGQVLAWSPDNRSIASAGADALIWHVDDNRWFVLRGEGEGIGAIAWSPDGAAVATGDANGNLRLWDATTGTPIGDPLVGHRGALTEIRWSSDGSELLTAGGGTLVQWSIVGSGLGSRLAPDENGTRDVAWSPDGAALLTANGEGVVRVIDPESGDVTRSLIATRRDQFGLLPPIRAVAWAPDGDAFATVSEYGELRLWPRSAAEEGSREGPSWRTQSGADDIEFTPSGDRLVAAVGNTIQLLDRDDGSPAGRPFEGHTGAGDEALTQGLNAIAAAPDGVHVASAGVDGTVRVWDINAHTVVDVLDEPTSALAWSPDSRLLALGDGGGRILLWDVANERAA